MSPGVHLKSKGQTAVPDLSHSLWACFLAINKHLFHVLEHGQL